MLNHIEMREAQSQSTDCHNIAAADAAVINSGTDQSFAGHVRTPAGNGLSISVSVCQILENPDAAETFLQNLTGLMAQSCLICLQADDFPDDENPIDAWQQFCAAIAARLLKANLSGQRIATCMHSHRMPLPAYCLVADSLLGRASRYVYLDGLQMVVRGNKRVETRANENWVFLWQQRGADLPVVPVYGGLVRSACKLLADETATTIEPTTSLLIPKGTAWTHFELPITRFCSDAGTLDWNRLQRTLRMLVVVADQLIDQSKWRNTEQQQDARANRRLAIHVTGLGDLLQLRKQQPDKLKSLEWLTALVREIRSELSQASARLAADRGAMPALLDSNPAENWQDGEHRDQWQRHWRKAVNEAALRNRNLLVLSPTSMLPSNGAGSAAFVDLLPLLALADAWSFPWNVPTPEWTLAQFKDFHCRARATIQASQRASLVAASI